MDSFRFPLEMHMIFYNMKYGSDAIARDMSDGLAVFAALFEVPTEQKPRAACLNDNRWTLN